MGACNIEGTYVSTDWKTGIEEVQKAYTEEYGYQEGYSGGPNCVSFTYKGDFTSLPKLSLRKYIHKRMDVLGKREGEIVKIGNVGYSIRQAKIKDNGATPSFLQRYLYKVKKPSVLLKFSLNCFSVIAEGSVRDMKALAREELRKAKYVGSYYIVKKDKYWKCIGEQKIQKRTQRKTNDKIMVLEMARYEYYGWAPE